MFGFSLIVAEIIISCLQQYFMVKSIVVERNLHSYYKLPVKVGNHLKLTRPYSQPSEEFYILQCPRNETIHIPKPKDMHACTIVGKYNDATLKEKEQPQQYVGSSKVKIRSMLHTKVDFKPKKLNFEGKCNYLGVEKSYKPITGPTKQKESVQKGENEEDKDEEEEFDDYRSENGKRLLLNYKLKHYQAKETRAPFKFLSKRDQFSTGTENQNLYTNQSNWRPTMHSNKKSLKKSELKNKPIKMIHNDSEEKNVTDSDEVVASIELKSPETPLKYLSVKDALKKLFNEKRQKYETKNDNGTSGAKQFFAENVKYRKGEKQVGLQTMYHRDEIFKDHIFYDDLDEHGGYANGAKIHMETEN